jgi:acyl carrier protein
VEPRTATDAAVCELLAEVLDVDSKNVGMTDDFFQLGGNSLLVTRLLTRIRDRTGLSVSVSAFFGEPTAAFLARTIGSQTGLVGGVQQSPSVPGESKWSVVC